MEKTVLDFHRHNNENNQASKEDGDDFKNRLLYSLCIVFFFDNFRADCVFFPSFLKVVCRLFWFTKTAFSFFFQLMNLLFPLLRVARVILSLPSSVHYAGCVRDDANYICASLPLFSFLLEFFFNKNNPSMY